MSTSLYWSFLHFVSITIFSILMSSALILVPQHDAIKNSEYWYEILIAGQFSFNLSSTLYKMVQCKTLFKLDCFMSIKTFLVFYGSWMLSIIILSFSSFALFVYYVHYNPPMPFTGLIGYLSYFISLIFVWFSMSHEERIKPQRWKQYKVYVGYEFLESLIFTILYALFIMMLKKTPSNIQWVVGLGLPIIREGFSWLKTKLLLLAFEETNSNVVEIIRTNVGHGLRLSVSLGTFATKMTGYIILSIDFAMNIWNSIKIVKLRKNIDPGSIADRKMLEAQKLALLELALIEIIEFIVPLSYVVSLVIALYGPNSSILGNYGNGYWTFRPIENLNKHLFAALEMFIIDCCSFVIGCIILWKFCSINFLMEACQQIKSYWFLIAVTLAQSLNIVGTSNN